MDWNLMFGKDNQPSFEEMAKFIEGEARELWEQLFSHMENCYGVKPKMSYSGCSMKPGWNVKLQKGSTSFGTLYPERNMFSVFMVISYKLLPEAENIRFMLSEKAVKMLDEAGDYMKMGKCVMFSVESEQDLSDYKLLMSVKQKPKNSEV